MNRKVEKLKTVNQQIWDLIRHYLHKHTELCLTGFGRFAAQSNEFTVDPIAKKIIPAQKRIYFQSGTFEYSTDFLSFSVAILQCSEQELVDNLSKFTKNFTQELQGKKRIEIEDLGIFKFNVMGEIDFESLLSDPFLDDTFGLKPIHFAANLLKTKRIVVETPEEEDAALVEMRESALKELKVLLDNARVAESNQVQKSTKVFPIVATVLTLILLINLALFLYKGPVDDLKQQISQMNIFENPASILDSQKAETINPEPVKIEEPAAAPAPVVVPAEPIVAETPAPIIEKPISKAPEIISEPTPIVTDEPTGAATIGKFMSKGYFEFDSTFYSIETIQETPALVQTNTTKNLEVANLTKPNLANKVVVEEPKSVSLEENKTTTETATELPYIVNVDAQINDIDKGFYVIAGAFKIESNALKFKEKLAKLGDSAAIVIKPSRYPYYLVSYQKSKNLNKALNLFEQKEKSHPSIWVYCAY